MKPRVFIFVIFALAAARGAAAQYVPIDLGTLGGTISSAAAVNESGQVVGDSFTAGNAELHAFSWTADGGMVDLGTLGGNSSHAVAVNESGQVVGDIYPAGNNGATHAFSWTATGGMVDLGTLGGIYSTAVGVSASGQVAGTSSTAGDAEIHAFLWTADQGMVDLGTLGGPASMATDVSASGQVVGYAMPDPNNTGITHAFSWTADGGMVDLGTRLDGLSFARRVSDSGQVVGDSFINGVTANRVFSWTPSGGMVDVGNLGSSASPTAVNETGQVVGYSYTGNVELHAFSWTAGHGMVDLGTLGGTQSTASAVNSTGQVVGWSTTAGDALTHAFSWTAAGGMVDLPELAVGGSGAAVDVNNHGQVVGSSAGHATMWVPPLSVCTLTLGYTAGTLKLGFTLQSVAPTTWSSWVVGSFGVVNLWSIPIPVVSPAVSLSVPIPNVPPIGPIGVLTVLSTPAQGVMCFDWKIVDTGGAGVAVQDLESTGVRAWALGVP